VQVTQATSSSTVSHCPEDMQLVLYRPPPNPSLADPAAAAAAIISGNLSVLQQHAQQPNGVAALWRSLTPGQRRSLAGMWDALRDQKMLAGMLRKLPAHDGQSAAAQDTAAGGTMEPKRDQQQQPACVIEEVSDGDEGQGQQMAVAAATAVEPLGGWPQQQQQQQQQQVVGATCAPAGDVMVIDTASEACAAAQQKLHHDECSMDLD
jgi:hypothetical protein